MSATFASFLPVPLPVSDRSCIQTSPALTDPVDVPVSAWSGSGIPGLPDLCNGDSLHDFLKESLALARDPSRSPDRWLAMLDEHPLQLLSLSRPGSWKVSRKPSDGSCSLRFDRAAEASSIFLRCPRSQMKHLDALLDTYLHIQEKEKKISPDSALASFSFVNWWDAVRLDALAVKLGAPQVSSSSEQSTNWSRAFTDHAVRVFSRLELDDVTDWWPGWFKIGRPHASDFSDRKYEAAHGGSPALVPRHPVVFSVGSSWLQALCGVHVDQAEALVHALRPVCPEAAAALSAWWVGSQADVMNSLERDRVHPEFQYLIRGTILWLESGTHQKVTHDLLDRSLGFIQRLPCSRAADYAMTAVQSAAQVWYTRHPALWTAKVNSMLASGASVLADCLVPTSRAGIQGMDKVVGLGPFMAIHDSSPWVDILLDMRIQLEKMPGVPSPISLDPIWTALLDRRSLERPETIDGRSTFPAPPAGLTDAALSETPPAIASSLRRKI